MRRTRRLWLLFSFAVLLLTIVVAGLARAWRNAEIREIAAREDLRRQASMRAAFWRLDGFASDFLAKAASLPLLPAAAGLAGAELPQSLPATHGAPFETSADGLPLPFLIRRFSASRAEGGAALVLLRESAGEDPLAPWRDRGAAPFWQAFEAGEARARVVAERETENANRVIDNAATQNFVAPPDQGQNNDLAERRSQAFRSATFSNRASESGTLGVESSDLRVAWIDGPGGANLFCMRRLKTRFGEALDVLWLDWSRMAAHLASLTEDIAAVDLIPDRSPDIIDSSDQLATFPVRAHFHFPKDDAAAGSLIRRWTISAFAVLGIAALAVGIALHRAIDFGERRQRFVSSVTHELRTPLTTFRLYAQMLADGMVESGATGEYLRTLRDESERLTRIVESMLVYARLESERWSPHLESATLGDLVRTIERVLLPYADECGLDLSTAVADENVRVVFDRQSIEQIAINLWSNAAKYAGPVDPRFVVEGRRRDSRAEVVFRDFGPGIDRAHRSRVFRAFERGVVADRPGPGGLGLGLMIARGLARSMRADLIHDMGISPGTAMVLRLELLPES